MSVNARLQLQRRKRIRKRAATLRRKRGYTHYLDPQLVAQWCVHEIDTMLIGAGIWRHA